MLGKTVRELAREITASEFASWIAYFEIEPYQRREDERMAILASTIARCAGNEVTPGMFLGEDTPKQSVEDQIATLRSLGK